MKRESKNPKTRVNFRIPKDLYQFAKSFATDKNTTVTQVLVTYLTSLRDSEKPDAR